MTEDERTLRNGGSDEHIFRPLAPLASGLTIIFGAAIALNLFEGLPRTAVLPLVVFDAGLALTFLGLRLALWRGVVPTQWANPVALAMAGLTLANVLLAYSLVGEAYYLVYVAIILIGCGTFLLSPWWLAVAIVTANGAWLALAWPRMTGGEILHYGFSVWAASVVSIVLFVARRRAISRANSLVRIARAEAQQRQRAEEAAAESREQLSLAISASKGGWWSLRLDPEQPTTLPDEIVLDPKIKSLIGFADDEIPNSRRAWMERVEADDREVLERAIESHLRGETLLCEVRYRIRHRDETLRWIHSCGRLERDAGGRPVRMSGIDWDITDRVEQRERLRKLSRAVEQSPSIVIITNTAGLIEYVNPKFTRVTGYGLEEVVGRTPAILRSSTTQTDVYQDLWRTIRAGLEWQGEFENVKKNGDPYRVISSISAIRDEHGEITHFVGVQEDITERRKVEEQLLQAQKMESVGQLVSGVAHDFNNLLTGIVGFSDLALASTDREHRLISSLQQIRKAGESAMSLTRQLLAFSRLQVLRPQVVDLNQVVEGLQPLLRHALRKEIGIELDADSRLGTVEVDPSQMEQILLNLAVNARDAMPGGGTLTITTKNVKLDGDALREWPEARPGSYVYLEVADTGCGMDEETRRRVFEPFFTTKKRGRGTGLGLSTVYGIVRQSGGSIRVESELGRGSRFRILLERVDTITKEAIVPEVVGTLEGGTESIILVEDDELVRSFAVRLLESKGYRLLSAPTAEEALTRCNGNRADLLVTDVVMPGMSGVELAEELGRRCPGIKVLFLSGYTDLDEITNSQLKPGESFLPKPFGATDLLKAVRIAIDETVE